MVQSTTLQQLDCNKTCNLLSKQHIKTLFSPLLNSGIVKAACRLYNNNGVGDIKLSSFPGHSCLQFLIAYCMQKRRRKAWEKESRARRQVDVRVDARGVGV